MAKNPNNFKRNGRASAFVWAGLLGLIFGLFSLPLFAEDDPFQMESQHWMSFEHYKDASKRGILEGPPPEQSAPEPAPESAPPPEQAAAAPEVAAPSRPIDLPIMPGLNKGFNVQVDSTEDTRISAPAPAAGSAGKTDIRLSDKNWQSPTSAQISKKSDDGDDADVPLNVRMTYLPDKKIVPIPSPEHASVQKAVHLALEKSIAAKNAPPPKTQAEAAACAAIDAYKKQQLDNIQSDRATLKALQEAIHSLGLEKQLDFMSGKNDALNVTAPQSASELATPQTTTVR